MYIQNPLTLNSILDIINNDPNPCSINTTIGLLQRLLKQMAFEYSKQGKKSITIQRSDIFAMKFRNQGRNVFYTSDTLVNAGSTVKNMTNLAFLATLSIDSKSTALICQNSLILLLFNKKKIISNTWSFRTKY